MQRKSLAKIVLITLLVGAGAIYRFVLLPIRVQKAVRTLRIADVDLSRVASGVHHGEFAYGGTNYRVEVTVADHRITAITVAHGRTSSHAAAAEGVIDRVIARQTPNVEAVTGATTTSKAILKAVEIALSQAAQ